MPTGHLPPRGRQGYEALPSRPLPFRRRERKSLKLSRGLSKGRAQAHLEPSSSLAHAAAFGLDRISFNVKKKRGVRTTPAR